MPSSPSLVADTVPEPREPAQIHRALYRRWRAQRFAELVGQDPIVSTLLRAVASDRIVHAYLFVGPRGTGKTSTARILAKAINCLDRGPDGDACDHCTACVAIREGRAMDVVEIDAASHGLVEDARDLVLRALTAPAELRRRVYIIDEVHMLSAHAFNALLKLVEEPPDHVVFILATTDTHRVPPTVISRTQRYDFRRLPADVIAGKLARIAEAEHVTADPDALALVARLGDGGMRDAESLLDQVMAYAGDRITVDSVRETAGLADDEAIAALVDALVAGDAPVALTQIDALADAGRDLAQVAGQAEGEARRRLLASAADPSAARRLAGILRVLAEAGATGARDGRARLLLELLSVDGALDAAPARPASPPPAVPEPPRAEPRMSPTRPTPPGKPSSAPAPAPIAAVSVPDGEGISLAEIRSRWAEVVERATPVIKPLIRECRPFALDGVRLTLAFPEGREFMRERIVNRVGAIEALLVTVFGGRWAVEAVAASVDLEPLSVEQAIGESGDPAAAALTRSILDITRGTLVDAPEVR